jgi:predicted GIY-YIG superfamily endonuclease
VAFYVYIVCCADRSYYVGSTRSSLELRIAQHNEGTFGGYTSTRRPVMLVFHQEFGRITDMISAERQVKRWTRAKKEALIRGK